MATSVALSLNPTVVDTTPDGKSSEEPQSTIVNAPSATGNLVESANQEAVDLEAAPFTPRRRSIDATEQSHLALERNFQQVASEVKAKMTEDPSSIHMSDVARLERADMRAHGHLEKGGITSQAMSIAMKNDWSPRQTNAISSCSRRASTSQSDREKEFREIEAHVKAHMEQDPQGITGQEANELYRSDRRAHAGYVQKGSITAQAQSLASKNERQHQGSTWPTATTNQANAQHSGRGKELQDMVAAIEAHIECNPQSATDQEADQRHRDDRPAHVGHIEEGASTAQAQMVTNKSEDQGAGSQPYARTATSDKQENENKPLQSWPVCNEGSGEKEGNVDKSVGVAGLTSKLKGVAFEGESDEE